MALSVGEILSKVDHTMLSVTSTWDDIKKICDEGMAFHTASVCIPPAFVYKASRYIKRCGSNLPVCTVIGFPNGYSTTRTKCFEAKEAIADGATEIDMVANIGWIKGKQWSAIVGEINAVKQACGPFALKVIIETCLLTKDEIIRMCKIVSKSDAEFIKTSTGFSAHGATFEDVELMAHWVSNGTKIKAAGGISSIADAEKFLELGASRLGTSRIVKLFNSEGSAALG